MAIEAVDAQLPHGVSVAYVQGVGDNSAPMLAELGVPVTVLDAHGLAAADLSRFTTVVIGTRAYESDPTLAAQNAAAVRVGGAGRHDGGAVRPGRDGGSRG